MPQYRIDLFNFANREEIEVHEERSAGKTMPGEVRRSNFTTRSNQRLFSVKMEKTSHTSPLGFPVSSFVTAHLCKAG